MNNGLGKDLMGNALGVPLSAAGPCDGIGIDRLPLGRSTACLSTRISAPLFARGAYTLHMH